MNLLIRSLKGMKDFIPKEVIIYQYIEKKILKLMSNYNFNEVRFPIVENSLLFNKNLYYNNNFLFNQMYNFYDKKNINISLRPEGTMGCLRMYIQNKLYNLKLFNKLWYIGPMFRYEKPQRGRYRQFIQVGIELFNNKDIISNLELILIINRLWNILDINENLVLEVNSIGILEDRINYLNYINNILKINKYYINNIRLKKVDFNLFKFLDNNNIDYINFINNFPNILNFINEKSLKSFKNLCKLFKKFNIKFKINYNLFRGLDYYNDFIFEWKYKNLLSQSTICAGGRYDYLIKNFCNKDIPAVGCAIGLDRLVLLIKQKEKFCNNYINKIDIYIICSFNEYTKILGLQITKKILDSDLIFLNIYTDYYKFNNLSNLILKIISLNCRILIIIDKKEFKKNIITIKDLYLNNQYSISKRKNIVNFINNLLNI